MITAISFGRAAWASATGLGWASRVAPEWYDSAWLPRRSMLFVAGWTSDRRWPRAPAMSQQHQQQRPKQQQHHMSAV